MFIRRITAAFILLAFVMPAIAAEEDAAARKAAEEWVALIDSGKYGDSWEHASDTFKKAITKESWETTVRRVREGIGKLQSWTFSKSQEMKNPPNAPPGEYYAVVYTSDFENKKGATEVIVVERQSGAWRTSGYFIK
jgi:hypothetical protein